MFGKRGFYVGDGLKISPKTRFVKFNFIFEYLDTAAFDDYLDYKLMDCWATPTDKSDDKIRFDLSANGCPSEDWIEMKNASCIGFPLFGFATAADDNLYVHCEIYICTQDSDECTAETAETCAANSGGRKRRHADAKTTMVSFF